MKKIVLLCNAGMSTSLLVSKMKDAAASESFECEITAYALSEAEKRITDADIVLLGPQVRYSEDKLKSQFPEKKIFCIDMMDYGMMNGKNVLKFAKKILGE